MSSESNPVSSLVDEVLSLLSSIDAAASKISNEFAVLTREGLPSPVSRERVLSTIAAVLLHPEKGDPKQAFEDIFEQYRKMCLKSQAWDVLTDDQKEALNLVPNT